MRKNSGFSFQTLTRHILLTCVSEWTNINMFRASLKVKMGLNKFSIQCFSFSTTLLLHIVFVPTTSLRFSALPPSLKYHTHNFLCKQNPHCLSLSLPPTLCPWLYFLLSVFKERLRGEGGLEGIMFHHPAIRTEMEPDIFFCSCLSEYHCFLWRGAIFSEKLSLFFFGSCQRISRDQVITCNEN